LSKASDGLITEIGPGISGKIYIEDNYALLKPDSEDAFATFGTQEARYPGSTALFNNDLSLGVPARRKAKLDALRTQ